MLNPQAASKSPISSRIALPVALMMAGIFGLAISLVQPPEGQGPAAPAVAVALPAAVAAPKLEVPVLAEREPAVKPEDLIEFCSRHVTDRRSFVVFKRGTCVIVNEPCEDPLAEALEILRRSKDPNARFLTEPTTDGDMIVTFKDPVFLRFSRREMDRIGPWLQKSATALLTPAESVAAGEGWVPPAHAQLGLFARRRMLEDATQAQPLKIIRAKERAIASR